MHFMSMLAMLFLSEIVADPSETAFFEQKIRPVLIQHCYECHSLDAPKLKGNLLLDSQKGWQQGGDSGQPSIVKGEPEKSPLIRFLKHLEVGMEMPPDKPKLTDAVIADFVTWVQMGAPDPRDGQIEIKRGDKSWWSLQPLANRFDHTSIDEFVAAKLDSAGLSRNSLADPRSLVRRMHYDLHGLPPSPEVVTDFIVEFEKNAQIAVENMVDRLLASPRYGERWGRHWLDVTRFGESIGFERNVITDDLWPFRDYIIRSLNDDKPFDRLIREHLAGDVIGKDDPDIEIGSAFLVAGPYDDVGNQSVVAQKNIRAGALDEIVTAVSSAFLGLTINCARCHHHKFDPIPTEDYYRMRSALEGVTHGRRVVASPQQREQHASALKPLQDELGKLNREKEALEESLNSRAKAILETRKSTRPKIDVYGTHETFTPVVAKWVRFHILASTNDFEGGKGKRGKAVGSSRLTEFQVWSHADDPINVALASNGATAEGAKSTTAEDYPDAYGPQFCIDGQFGEQWFVGNPARLTITLAKPETIHRITFINARGSKDIDESKVRGATPCEYEVQVSLDGQNWQTVASHDGREPWSEAHGIAQIRSEMATQEDQQILTGLERQIAKVQHQLNTVPKLPQMWVGNLSQPKQASQVDVGGDPMKPGQPIEPASLNVLDQVTKGFQLQIDAPESERRLALADWITRSDNPLTPRVLANRVWQYHFGSGIVDTPSDLGYLGSRPTHPELLDYLAQRLLTHGWRLKPLHREIMLSQTYLQSSTWRDDAARVDHDARSLWRFSPRRLSAEEIRDTFLVIAGEMKLEPMGGPGFRLYKMTQNNVCTYFPLDQHGPETYRRSVYHQNARASVVDILNDFDLPDIAFAAPKRANTTTPAQALTLLNHSFTLDMSKSLAGKLTPGREVEEAYRKAFQRESTSEEREAARKFIASHGLEAFCRALLNANELIYLD